MYKLGNLNELTVSRFVDFGAYLKDDEANELLLPIKRVPEGTKIGDTLKVFVYLDSEDRPIATTQPPKVVVGDIAFLKVADVNQTGAFLDWGLEKDLLLPYKHQKQRLQPGQKCMIKVMLDKTSNRIIATTKIMERFIPGHDQLKEGDQVDIQVCEEHELGFVVIVNDLFPGMVYANEIHGELALGEKRKAYIKAIRLDTKLDISLKPIGLKAIAEDRDLILDKFKETLDGFLPFNAKSDAEAIKKEFQLSKKAFKKAIGGLYKDRIIEITDSGMKLVKKS